MGFVNTLWIHADRRLECLRMDFAVIGGADRRLAADAVGPLGRLPFARLRFSWAGFGCFGRMRKVGKLARDAAIFGVGVLKRKQKEKFSK